MEKFEKLCDRIQKFNDDRDWHKFHSPVNMAKCVVIEAAELLECFQWSNDEFDKESLKEELADVFNNCIMLSQVLGIDIVDACNDKMTKNENKYPVSKCKGKNTKYNKL